MSGKTLLVSEKFDPKKKYNVHIRKQVSQVLKTLEKVLGDFDSKGDDTVDKE